LSHGNKCGIHSPFEHYLLLLDNRVHKVSAEEDTYLWIKCFFPDLFNKDSHLKYLDFLAIRVHSSHWLLDSSVLEYDISRASIKENILPRLSGCVSLGESVKGSLFLSIGLNLLLVLLLLCQASFLSLDINELYELTVADERYFHHFIKVRLVLGVIVVHSNVQKLKVICGRENF
jgi:hypothetical protein